MRTVVDTNIFVSALLKDESLPALALRSAARLGRILKSDATEMQVRNVVARPYLARLIAPAGLAWIDQLLGGAETITVGERISACRDPTDDKFLELAVSGRADVILTGDNDLLVLHPFRNVSILSPATFLAGLAAT